VSYATELKGGVLQRIPPNASADTQINTINVVIDHLNALLKTQVFADENNKRMLLGFQKDGWGAGKDFGIKISKEGVDVTSATDEQLLFKMDMQTWYFYDPTTGKNYMQFGILPDGVGGLDVAAPGYDVSEAY
jgi:hypothetical protein